MKENLIRIIVLILVTVAVGDVSAQQLNEQEAKARAMRYLNTRGKAFTRGGAPAGKDLALISARVEARGIYAFNCEGGGYVIVSGDSRALPVLGYSDTGAIDWEQMPENMRVWLRLYDEAIATLGDRTDFTDGDYTNGRMTTRTSRAAVEPLIKTNWYQVAPYNYRCPLYEGADTTKTGQRCLTGCIATATAQVLNYYQWPKTIEEGLPGYDLQTVYENEEKVWHVDSLPPVTFEWADMLDRYVEAKDGNTNPQEILGTEAQQQAVATLMRYCGQATLMNYGADASAASPLAQYEALVNRFGYDAATLLSIRSLYGIDEWEDIIYGELVASRPVLYFGYSDEDGHSFICDGYDGDGMFHINWGWGGKDDGYFSLSVLNPYNNTSAGSGSNGIGFSINQGAIIYLDPTMDPLPSPEEGKPELFQYTSMSLTDDHKVKFQFIYRKDDAGTVTVDNALGTVDDDGTVTPRFMGDLNDSIVYNANYMLVEIDSTAFLPGDSLRLYPMLRFRHADAPEWQIIPPDDYCLYAGRTADGMFFIHIKNVEGSRLQCMGGAITKGTGAANQRSDVTVIVRNPDEKDFIGELCLVPYYGEEEGKTMVCGACLRARQEGDVTFSFKPLHSGPVTLMLTTDSGLPLGSFTLDISEPTGIKAIEKESKGQVLNILLPKGIYIKDGKKYMK